MAIHTTVKRTTIPPGEKERHFHATADFSHVPGATRINSLNFAINGFDLYFTGNRDHNMGRVMVNVNSLGATGVTANYDVGCQFRDDSNNDDYEGYVEVLVIADVS